MGGEAVELTGPDFAKGVVLSRIPEGGLLLGHTAGKAVLVARHRDEVFAIGAHCTHYSGPLADGLLVGDTIRCPWHHACFSLRTGEAVSAPALNPVARWTVERRGDSIFVGDEIPVDDSVRRWSASAPESVVIVGGGAAGNAAAEMLRREGYAGQITMISADDSVPYDRPNLSKDYLAGTAQEEWIPLRSIDFYEQQRIKLLLGRRVETIDVSGKRVELDDGSSHGFGALLLATGAEPIRLKIPVADGARLLYLRTLADSKAIIAAAQSAKCAVVLGASFIGLEVAASLRARGLEVHVVAPEARPLERILGPELGDFIRGMHTGHGVIFHMGQIASRIAGREVTLGNGEKIAADFVVAGIGVRPNEDLAARAGLAVEKGVVVDEFLETSAPGIFAAGDIARYPDSRLGERIRVEHWVVAERQGQTAARNILGRREKFSAVPFFWSQHYDVAISYVGHALRWDAIEMEGSLDRRDCTARFVVGGRTLAVATVGRDRESLMAELKMERSA